MNSGNDMRFEHAVDILTTARETLQKQIFTDFSYSEYINTLNRQYNAQREAQIDDIDDAINTLYALREVCPNKEQ